MRWLLRFIRAEFAVAIIALFGVLVLGILAGVALGVVLALAILIRCVCRPSTAVLGRLPGTDDYRDTAILAAPGTNREVAHSTADVAHGKGGGLQFGHSA